LIEHGRFGTLLGMRALSASLFLVYLSVGASPCIGGSGEKPAHKPHPEAVAGSHADCEARGLMDSTAHQRGAVAEAESELQARCPCGCEDGDAAANSFVRLGNGLLACVNDPTSIGSCRGVAVEVAEYAQAPPQAVDHVPISA
jgi:hypothetical protein